MTPRAVSAVIVVGGVESHFTLTFANQRFLLRDTDTRTETAMDPLEMIVSLTAPFAESGPAFLALIDHAGAVCDIGFAARRYRGDWSDITAPDTPMPVSWHDVENELWAALLRLSKSHKRPA